MIQNLENKMESQINSLETRIENMQERFNKDLEEIKKSQYIMNNAINEIKNTLEGTNSRIMEAEDRISEVEDRMVEINEAERKKEKRIKRNGDNLRDRVWKRSSTPANWSTAAWRLPVRPCPSFPPLGNPCAERHRPWVWKLPNTTKGRLSHGPQDARKAMVRVPEMYR